MSKIASKKMNSVFNIEPNFAKSKGHYVYDNLSGQYFFDAFMMYSSLPLGYNNEIFDEGFDELIKSISSQKVSTSVFKYPEIDEFISEIAKTSGLHNIHLCSTGALAVESAIKAALYKHGGKKNKVLSLANGFHGVNSWGFTTDASAVFAVRRLEFFPRLEWPNIGINELCSYLSNPDNSDNIAAFIFEPIQCTAGDIYLDPGILSEARDICAKNDICFIADEIQTGMGTTGNFWKSVSDNLTPDIIVFGKKSQISGVMMNDKYSAIINNKNQILSVTYDGDIIDAIRGLFVLRAINRNFLLENIKEKSKLLGDLVSKKMLNYRSMGGLIAFDFESIESRNSFTQRAFENYLLVNPTGQKSIRIRLNLAVSADEVLDLGHRILKSISI